MNRVIKLPVILAGRCKVVEIPVNKKEGQPKRQPEKDAKHTKCRVRGNQMVDPLVKQDDAKAAGRQQNKQDQLDRFIDKIGFSFLNSPCAKNPVYSPGMNCNQYSTKFLLVNTKFVGNPKKEC